MQKIEDRFMKPSCQLSHPRPIDKDVNTMMLVLGIELNGLTKKINDDELIDTLTICAQYCEWLFFEIQLEGASSKLIRWEMKKKVTGKVVNVALATKDALDMTNCGRFKTIYNVYHFGKY